MLAAAGSRRVVTEGRAGYAFVQGHVQDDDQQDEQSLPHGLVLAVPVVVAPFFAHHIEKAQDGHAESHDTGQIEHEDAVHTVS